MTLTYTPPKPVRKPFETGQIVDVCDRDLKTMSQVKVRRSGKKVTTLVDGRRFRSDDGYWIGETGVWPFPSIRHPRRQSK